MTLGLNMFRYYRLKIENHTGPTFSRAEALMAWLIIQLLPVLFPFLPLSLVHQFPVCYSETCLFMTIGNFIEWSLYKQYFHSWSSKHIQRSFYAWTCMGLRMWVGYKYDGSCISKLSSTCLRPIPVSYPPSNGARRAGLPLGYLEKLIGSCPLPRSCSDPTAAGSHYQRSRGESQVKAAFFQCQLC